MVSASSNRVIKSKGGVMPPLLEIGSANRIGRALPTSVGAFNEMFTNTG